MHGLPSFYEIALLILFVTSPGWLIALASLACVFKRNRWRWRWFILASPFVVALVIIMVVVFVASVGSY